MEALGKDVEFFSIENMQNNEKVVEFCHTAMCVMSGCIAGIIGLTGLSGFALMMALYLVTAVMVLVFKMNGNVKEYFNASTPGFVLGGVFSHSLSFILFWTLSYGLVHIY
ncbi:TPA: hypothetical protein N0F65_006031 [Lagenidium giganteum]|uniref:ER membrane protein complex subunit 6 n=1 Tax=Lagenidium giganteum TaxID=4803 RepID=A0AAV2Z4L3_9STRA|nr:TPA: hypothetical protein N0F65_006031 [Lagenidium giganteum]